MINYVVYSPANNGEILRTGVVPTVDMMLLQPRDDEDVMEGQVFDEAIQHVVEGELQLMAPESQRVRKNPPSFHHVWNWKRMQWEDLRSSAEVKRIQLLDYETEMAQLESGQARALREATLTGDKTRLQELDDQITSVRRKYQMLKLS